METILFAFAVLRCGTKFPGSLLWLKLRFCDKEKIYSQWMLYHKNFTCKHYFTAHRASKKNLFSWKVRWAFDYQASHVARTLFFSSSSYMDRRGKKLLHYIGRYKSWKRKVGRQGIKACESSNTIFPIVELAFQWKCSCLKILSAVKKRKIVDNNFNFRSKTKIIQCGLDY